MNALTTFSYADQTMTSLQIAEVTEKRHGDVLRAIRNMEPAWEKITRRKFAFKLKITEIGNMALRETPYYELTKTECLYIATKFNDEARARLILRWEELEKELLSAPRPSAEAETLPPPTENQQVTPSLVEYIDGKPVTTSRKVAQALGRKHSSILRTIRENRHLRAFKYGNFIKRPYSEGPIHGYEFLITRKGLAALAVIMRHSAKERIAEAFERAWNALPAKKALPAAETPALPALAVETTACRDTDDEITYTPEQQKYIDWLEGYNEDIAERLRKAKETMRMYAEMYSGEKAKRCQSENRAAYWHDLYEDLVLRVQCIKDADELIDAHAAFKKRITVK